MASRTLARFLRDWLRRHDMTQRQLAAVLPGVTETRVSRWVTGQDIPAPRYRDDLARVLEIGREELDRICAHRDPVAVARSEIRAAEQALQRARSALDD